MHMYTAYNNQLRGRNQNWYLRKKLFVYYVGETKDNLDNEKEQCKNFAESF